MIGLAFFLGSGSGLSGQHLGRQVAVVVRLFVRRTVDKFGGEKVDALTSFGFEMIEMFSVGRAHIVTNKEEAKQMIRGRDSIGMQMPFDKIKIQVCEGSTEEGQR